LKWNDDRKMIEYAWEPEKKEKKETCDSPMPGRRSGAASKKHSVTITITTIS